MNRRPVSASNLFSSVSARNMGASRLFDNYQMEQPKKKEPEAPPPPLPEDKDLAFIIKNKPKKSIVREYFREKVRELDDEVESF